jgi:hypothetical protein
MKYKYTINVFLLHIILFVPIAWSQDTPQSSPCLPDSTAADVSQCTAQKMVTIIALRLV